MQLVILLLCQIATSRVLSWKQAHVLGRVANNHCCHLHEDQQFQPNMHLIFYVSFSVGSHAH